MANIQRYLELIKSAIYGREVRDSICDAIEAIDEEVSDAHVEMSEFVQGNMDDTLTSTTLPAQAKAVGDAIENYRVPVDTTLTHQDEAADAEATGNAINDVVIASSTQPSSDFNQIWIDDEAEDEYTVPTYSEFSEVQNALNQLNTAISDDIGKALSPKTVHGGKVTEWQFKTFSGGSGGVSDYTELANKPKINNTTLNGNQTSDDLGLQSYIGVVNVDDFGAVSDGITDDSEAIHDAVDAGYDIYFSSNKTYYLASAVEIDEDKYLHGGENTVIQTKTPTEGEVNKGFYVHGTLKKTTTITTDYKTYDSTDNSANRITLSDMTDINIGDILVITASDQYYAYSRQYYYLGAVLLITDIYDGHLYVNMSIPFDIIATNNVTVLIYDAPEVHFKNLHFISDLDSFGSYNALIDFNYCKNSTLIDCTFTRMVMGVYFRKCVNSLIDNISLSKSKYDNAIGHDGYGLAISSCTNTVIRRVLALCSQSCIDLTGDVPNINTYIFESCIASEARAVGLGLHENSYNIVVEDCVLGGMSAYGLATINRCHFIKNNRGPNSNAGINYRGCHNAEWSKLRVTNCIFDGNMAINILAPDVQNPIQSYKNCISSIQVENCDGGFLSYLPSVSQTILANEIDALEIIHWKNCNEIYHSGTNSIKFLKMTDCTFRKALFLNDHNNAHGIVTTGIDRMEIRNSDPLEYKVKINRMSLAEKQILPKNVSINITANDETDQFLVCGSNLVSDNANDYAIGSISGNVGDTLTRTVITGSNIPTLSINANGDVVYSQNSNTSKRYLYNRFMFLVNEITTVQLSVKIKNTGNTDPESWMIYCHTVDNETGLVAGRSSSSSAVTASNIGDSASLTVSNISNRTVLFSFYCSTAVSDAETTFEDITITLTPAFNVGIVENKDFEARRLTGSGIITSIEGVNNIMTSADSFYVDYGVDYLIGALNGDSITVSQSQSGILDIS